MASIELSLFLCRMTALCEEMGAVIRHSAFSPNIKDRLDFSCAVFDPAGELCAQAAHIPVHLGSMAYAMRQVVGARAWAPGDMLILNDPFLGGTHLPDVTLVAPAFHGGRLCGFVANRAHHADIGCATPGSMPLATRLEDEGLLITPRLIQRGGIVCGEVRDGLLAALRNPDTAWGDFVAQMSANHTGLERLGALIGRTGAEGYLARLAELQRYAGRMAREGLRTLPEGRYRFEDCLDDDGLGRQDLTIRVNVDIGDGEVEVDFDGSSGQVPGNVNCPLSVAAAAVYYVFYCLMPAGTPPCAGSFSAIRLRAPQGSLVNARPPAAVAAGNVETSSRIVDAVLGALAPALPGRVPAASQGSMNNVAFGGPRWEYYETLGGGMGASAAGPGLSAVQTHMTNTLNTPIEVLELRCPVRVRRYALREGSGGEGLHRGGDGLVREFEFLDPAVVTLLTERRRHAPWGLAGGAPGAPGLNRLNGRPLPGKASFAVQPGDRLRIETPGGGGWGSLCGPRGTR